MKLTGYEAARAEQNCLIPALAATLALGLDAITVAGNLKFKIQKKWKHHQICCFKTKNVIKFWRFRRDFEEILFFFNVGGGVLLLLVVPLEVERDGLALVQGAETLGIDGGLMDENLKFAKFYLFKFSYFWKLKFENWKLKFFHAILTTIFEN